MWCLIYIYQASQLENSASHLVFLCSDVMLSTRTSVILMEKEYSAGKFLLEVLKLSCWGYQLNYQFLKFNALLWYDTLFNEIHMWCLIFRKCNPDVMLTKYKWKHEKSKVYQLPCLDYWNYWIVQIDWISQMMPKISLFWHRFYPASHLCKTGLVLKKKKKKKIRLFHLESLK